MGKMERGEGWGFIGGLGRCRDGRTVAMDVVEDDDDGWGGRRRLVWGWGVLARMVYEWENAWRGTGNHVFGMRLSEIWESYKLIPRLKFGRLVGWG